MKHLLTLCLLLLTLPTLADRIPIKIVGPKQSSMYPLVIALEK